MLFFFLISQIVGEVLKQLTEEKCKWIGLLISKEKKSGLPFLPRWTFEMLISLMMIMRVDDTFA